MGDDVKDRRAEARPYVMVLGLAVLAVAAASLLAANGVSVHRIGVAVAAAAAALLVVAGCYRLAKWQLRRDAHSGLAGSALLLVGAVVVPARALAEVVSGEATASMAALAVRGAGSLLALALLQRALTTHELRGVASPPRLVPVLLVAAAAVFTSTLALEYAVEARGADVDPRVLAGLSALIAIAWCGHAEMLRRHRSVAPWAGRVAPLLVGMGLAEALRAAGGQVPSTATLAAQLLTVGVGFLAVRSAVGDLDQATGEARVVEQHLSQRVHTISAELEEHESWRRTLRHESRNTCAGLRAALTMFADPDGTVPPEVAARLRDAAVTELLGLEELLDPRPATAPTIDLRTAVEEAAAPLSGLGAGLTVWGSAAPVAARADDVVVVVRDLLLQLVVASPVRHVVLGLATDGGRARLEVSCTPSWACPEVDVSSAQRMLGRAGGEVTAGPEPGRILVRLPVAVDADVSVPAV